VTAPRTRWWWLRHAAIADGPGRIFGARDVACDTSDQRAFAGLARHLPRDPVVVASGMLRTAQTIDALRAAGLPLRPARTQPAFAEQSFGRWEGLTWSALHEAGGPEIAAFWNDPANLAPPGGESFADVVARVATAFCTMNEEIGDGDILAVVHAGTIRAALAFALAIEPAKALRFAIDPLSLTRIDVVAEDVYRVTGVNWVASRV
jgi:alpha-ribazole phosphatase